MRLRSASQLFAYGQILLAICLLVSTALVPGYFFSTNQGGISNYGTEDRTVDLFIAGFVAAAIGAGGAALCLSASSKRQRQLRVSIAILAVLYILVMLSTFSYKQDESYRQLHEQASLVLFAYMTAMAVWLRFQATMDISIKWAFWLFVAGLLIGLGTLFGPLHLLFTAQVTAAAAFGYIVSRSLKVMTD